MRLCASLSRDDPSDLAPDTCFIATSGDGAETMSLPADVQLVISDTARPVALQLLAFADPDAPADQVEVHPALFEVLAAMGADLSECSLRKVEEWGDEDVLLPADSASLVGGRPERGEASVALLSLVGRPLRRGLLHPAVHAEGVCLVSLEGGSEQLVVPPGLAATAVVTATQRQSPPQPRCRGLAALPADFLQSTLTGAPVLFKEEIQALWMRVAAALPSCLLGPHEQALARAVHPGNPRLEGPRGAGKRTLALQLAATAHAAAAERGNALVCLELDVPAAAAPHAEDAPDDLCDALAEYALGCIGAVGTTDLPSTAVVGVLVVVCGAETAAVSPAMTALVHAATTNLGARLRRRADYVAELNRGSDDLQARGARWARGGRVEACALELRAKRAGDRSNDGEAHALAAPVRLAGLSQPAGARLVACLAPGARDAGGGIRPPGGLYPLDIVEAIEASGWLDGDSSRPAPDASARDLQRALAARGIQRATGSAAHTDAPGSDAAPKAWDRVLGVDDAKRRLLGALGPGAMRSFVRPARGVLLTGPSGCGKSTLARALASRLGLNAVNLGVSSVFSGYLGESERAVRAAFARARAAQPCALIVDDVDILCGRRAMGDGAEEGGGGVAQRVLTTFLTEMDGIDSAAAAAPGTGVEGTAAQEPRSDTSRCDAGGDVGRGLYRELQSSMGQGSRSGGGAGLGVVVVATAASAEGVDRALLRPGRFDLVLPLPEPDRDTLVEALAQELAALRVSLPLERAGLERVVDARAIRTVADVEQVVQEASRHAVARFVSQRPADGESASEAEAPGIGEADLLGVATNASD